MNQRPYTQIVDAVESLAGSNLESEEKKRLKPLINRRLRQVYRRSNLWPRFLRVGNLWPCQEDGLIAPTTGISTWMRINLWEPWNCRDSGEVDFYADAEGVHIINPCLSRLKIDDIQSVSSESGVITVSIGDDHFKFWSEFLAAFQAVGDQGSLPKVTFDGVTGTPYDSAINGEQEVNVTFNGQNVELSFTGITDSLEPLLLGIGATNPLLTGIYYSNFEFNGKPFYSTYRDQEAGVDPPPGNYNWAYWDGSSWILTTLTVTTTIDSTVCWTGTQDVPTPDLVTNWVAQSGSTGAPVFVFSKIIVPWSGTPTGDVRAFGVYATYKEAQPLVYGTGEGEEPNIPDEWTDVIIQGTYADWLRAEGQTEKATYEENKAEEMTLDALQEMEAQKNNQSVGKNINVRGRGRHCC